jgi:hypothetical protein
MDLWVLGKGEGQDTTCWAHARALSALDTLAVVQRSLREQARVAMPSAVEHPKHVHVLRHNRCAHMSGYSHASDDCRIAATATAEALDILADM